MGMAARGVPPGGGGGGGVLLGCKSQLNGG